MKCVVKFNEGYLKGKSSLSLVDDLWKARIYNGVGAAESSIKALSRDIERNGWNDPKIVEIEIYEKGSIENFIGNDYFGSVHE